MTSFVERPPGLPGPNPRRFRPLARSALPRLGDRRRRGRQDLGPAHGPRDLEPVDPPRPDRMAGRRVRRLDHRRQPRLGPARRRDRGPSPGGNPRQQAGKRAPLPPPDARGRRDSPTNSITSRARSWRTPRWTGWRSSIEPDGVKLHRLTDAAVRAHRARGRQCFRRARMPPRPRIAPLEAEGMEPPRPLPRRRPGLAPAEWRALYERSLESTNQRLFGLFHFADETEARVRNVTYRGQWPRTLPPTSTGTGGEVEEARQPAAGKTVQESSK